MMTGERYFKDVERSSYVMQPTRGKGDIAPSHS
jgi:hypothetical protein